MMKIKITKKTDFPDLEQLPPHNHLKHFFNCLFYKFLSLIMNLIKKNDLELVNELKILKIKLEQKELELTHQRYLIQEFNLQLNKYLIK